MLGTLERYLFFIASFSPLWAIMTIRYAMDNPGDISTYVGICAVIAIVLPSILFTAKKFSKLQTSSNSKTLYITKSRKVTTEYTPYVVSCLFPMFVVVDGISTLFTIIATMTLVGILYVKTRMILTNNPALILAGFRIYEIDAKNYARTISIICKKFPQNGNSIRVRDVDYDLCIEQKDQV